MFQCWLKPYHPITLGGVVRCKNEVNQSLISRLLGILRLEHLPLRINLKRQASSYHSSPSLGKGPTFFIFFNKPEGTKYDLFLGRIFQKSNDLEIFNGALYLSWHKLQTLVVDMGYWYDTMIDGYQWNRSMVETEDLHTQSQILDVKYDKLDLE